MQAFQRVTGQVGARSMGPFWCKLADAPAMLQQPHRRILTHDVRVLLQAEESNNSGLADLSSAD